MTRANIQPESRPNGDRRRVRLSKLPNLEEVPHANPVEELFAQAVLLQLKAMRKDVSISQLAFDDLCFLSLLQLDDFLQSLKKITQVQRRTKISKHDLELYFSGSDMDIAGLAEQADVSNYIHGKYIEETNQLHETVEKVQEQFMKELNESELLSSEHSEFFVQDVDILNLLPSSNRTTKYLLNWLPELPPDHTYRFTSLYKKPITDERLLKRKLAEEGRLSEKALLNMLRKGGTKDNSQDGNEDMETIAEQTKEAQLESDLIFGNKNRHRQTESDSTDPYEAFKPLPVKNFDVVEYCKGRSEIIAHRAQQKEHKLLAKRRNPFIKGALLCSPYGQGNSRSRKSIENQLKTMLKRSYLGMMDYIPKVTEQRNVARKEAEDKEKELQEQRRLEKEKRMAAQEVLDLSNLQNDPLLHGWDNDSDDDLDADEEMPHMDDNLDQLPSRELLSSANEAAATPSDGMLDNDQTQENTIKDEIPAETAFVRGTVMEATATIPPESTELIRTKYVKPEVEDELENEDKDDEASIFDDVA